MRANDWYFRGWKLQTDENGKKAYVYQGEYYSFPKGLQPIKESCAILAGILIVLYLLLAFFPSPGGMWRIAAIPQLLELIPLIYLVIGTVNLLRLKENSMTFRDYHTSWKNICWSSWLSLILTAAMAVVEVVYLCLFDDIAPIREMLFFMGEMILAVISWQLVRIVRGNPCSQTASQNTKEQ